MSTRFFTLKQLEELDALGPTVYLNACPGIKEEVEIDCNILFAEDEISDEDIIEVE